MGMVGILTMKNIEDIENQIRLIREALGEITEYLGSTLRNPISVSQRCIDFGFSFDEKAKMQAAFCLLSDRLEEENKKLSIEDCRKIIEETHPSQLGRPYSDDLIVGFVKGYARMIPDLELLSKDL
ncbi:hypothetical protein [Clostridium sp. E02]|uniref:hypothetical protein n=1 Tax=Clostridium sp. E02 TaxID=2487134 RepID=UPI0013DE3D9F|nr:hypothetical protein [Clostridium sp. E02]